MKFLFGKRFWWFVAAFHVCIWALVIWFVSMMFDTNLVIGGRIVHLSKPALAVLLWAVAAGPATVVAVLLRWLRKRWLD